MVYFSKKSKKEARERRKKGVGGGMPNGYPSSISTAADGANIVKINPIPDNTQQRGFKIISLAGERERECPSTSSNSSTGVALKDVAPKVVEVPEGLNGKEARVFRKKRRREAKMNGEPEPTFTTASSSSEAKASDAADKAAHELQPAQKKVKRSFPNLNELVKEQNSIAAASKEQAKAEKAERKKQSNLVELTEDEKNKYVALDCEMVGVGSEGKVSHSFLVSRFSFLVSRFSFLVFHRLLLSCYCY